MTKAALRSIDLPPTVLLDGHALQIDYTASARRALSSLNQALEIELELYFSCLIRKRVHFRNHTDNEVFARTMLAPDISISFRPVMTEICVAGEIDKEPDVELFPLVRETAFVPKWLHLDYRQGQWQGEFGYA